jgi:hypothetical protein
MPFDSNSWSKDKMFSYLETRNIIEDKYKLIRNPDEKNAVSKVTFIHVSHYLLDI